MSPTSHLDRPASVPVLRRLVAAQALSPAEALPLEQSVRRDLSWLFWLDRALLVLGVVLIISGVGYFFAHNWKHLTDSDKIGLAAGSIFFSLLAGTWIGLDRFAGKLLLTAASVFVGMFLGVFAQVYQTGQNGFEALTMWAVLIFPWVVLGRFMPLWLFWLYLVNAALGFYWTVAPINDHPFFDQAEQISLSLCVVNLSALILREAIGRRNIPWIDRGWSALVLVVMALLPATWQTCAEILNTWDSEPHFIGATLSFFALAAVIGGLGFYYSRVRYSLPALSVLILSACMILTVTAARLVVNGHGEDQAGTWFLLGLIILAIFGGGVFFLRKQRAAHLP